MTQHNDKYVCQQYEYASNMSISTNNIITLWGIYIHLYIYLAKFFPSSIDC
jgi:hypothetical protein